MIKIKHLFKLLGKQITEILFCHWTIQHDVRQIQTIMIPFVPIELVFNQQSEGHLELYVQLFTPFKRFRIYAIVQNFQRFKVDLLTE